MRASSSSRLRSRRRPLTSAVSRHPSLRPLLALAHDPQFRFDWFLKSRNATELQRRTDTLVRLIEAESGKSDVPAKRKSGSKKQGGPAKKKGRKSESAK